MKHPTRTHYGNRGTWDETPKPPVFPHAQSATLAEAPDRCDRCGGIWRPVSEGYQCRACPRRWHAGDKLREMVGRPLESVERFPVVRLNPGGGAKRAS